MIYKPLIETTVLSRLGLRLGGILSFFSSTNGLSLSDDCSVFAPVSSVLAAEETCLSESADFLAGLSVSGLAGDVSVVLVGLDVSQSLSLSSAGARCLHLS